MCKCTYVSVYARKITIDFERHNIIYFGSKRFAGEGFISTKLCKLRLYIHSLFAYSMTWEEKYHFSFLLLVSTVMTSKP